MALVLDRRNRFRLILSGALLGAVIGPLGLWLDVRPKLGPDVRSRFGSVPEALNRWVSRLSSPDAGWPGLLMLAVPFVATLIIMPRFVRWLETRADRDPRPFYLQAALGGVAFGAAVTALIAWGLMTAAVIAGSLTSAGNPEESSNAIIVTTVIFAPLVGLSAPFLVIQSLIVLGVPFGLLYGGLVRRLVREQGAERPTD